MVTVAEPLCVRRPLLRPLCLRAKIARMIVERVLDSVPVRVVYPDGTVRFGIDEPGAPKLEIVRPAALFDRVGDNPKIGLGEAYMAGDWRAAAGTDLADLLTPFAARLANLVPAWLTRLRVVVDKRIPRSQRNTVDGARKNISSHYDLSNELFAQFLDPSMTYSSAWFDAAAPFAGQSLENAQHGKIGRILDLANVAEGSRVLEIGTGWGTLAIEAARRGAHVTSVTISKEQYDLASERVAEAGLADEVDLRLQDYRHVRGTFDSIVSVEMIEAVGEAYWPTYFATLDRLLAPNGTIGLQAILMDDDRMLATRKSYGWIQKYIFPGGLIPSLDAIQRAMSDHTGLGLVGRPLRFGEHYAETLRRWRRRFMDNWPQICDLGLDSTARRAWEFYLAYCEAGFRSGYLDVAQLQLAHRNDDRPEPGRHEWA
ncbi:cyclopropane-fatty-acyl-phospholipid synthase family protein [Nocardioidaceae bacterium SCSIO 66511]|nr:cyclopropane-fatty-acyl-phospholipid synthase family protein [Nocardioidaceae bacterium SCSIO 66511]